MLRKSTALLELTLVQSQVRDVGAKALAEALLAESEVQETLVLEGEGVDPALEAAGWEEWFLKVRIWSPLQVSGDPRQQPWRFGG